MSEETSLVPVKSRMEVMIDCPEEAESTATWMADEFADATKRIKLFMEAIDAQVTRLTEVFPTAHSYSFGISYRHLCHDYSAERSEELFKEFKRDAWRILADKLGVKNVMSVKRRKEFERQLEKGDLPELNAAMILGIIRGLAGQAKEFAEEAAKEVFDIMRPRGHYGGEYKTNNAFRVGRKVILPFFVEGCYRAGAFRVNYNHDAELIAIDGVFHLLDGKGIMRENRGELVNAIGSSPDGRGETTYFKFKCYKNRNLHLEMKRLDLVIELNRLAAGEAVLGHDPE